MSNNMTPLEAKAKYDAEWPALNAAKEEATERGDAKTAKKCRQQLSHLSLTCKARHELDKPYKAETEEGQACFCPNCGAPLSAEAQLQHARAEALREAAEWFAPYDPTIKTDSRWMHITEELRRMADEIEGEAK